MAHMIALVPTVASADLLPMGGGIQLRHSSTNMAHHSARLPAITTDCAGKSMSWGNSEESVGDVPESCQLLSLHTGSLAKAIC